MPLRLRHSVPPPSQRGVVVVGSGIDNSVSYITMGQVVVRPPAAKAELQNPHARQIELLPQRIHFARNHAQVFGDQRQLAQLVEQGGEQSRARRLDPLPMDGGLLLDGNGPESLKAAKVVEPDNVVERMVAAHPV